MSDISDLASLNCQIFLMLLKNSQTSKTSGMKNGSNSKLFEQLIAVQPEGMTRNAWAIKAGLNRNIFSDIRNRGNTSVATMNKLLDAIGMTSEQFEASKNDGYQVESTVIERPSKANAERRSTETPNPYTIRRQPKDVPVLGTASCGDHDISGGKSAVEAMEFIPGDPVDYIRRPEPLEKRRDIYAISFTGTSMSPKFEPGEQAFVDPNRAPAIMDYVIVQLRAENGDDGEHVVKVLAKQLVKQSPDYVELRQFDPDKNTFRIERDKIKAIHRIIPWDELINF